MGINKNGCIEDIPEGFDRSVIVHRDRCQDRRQAHSIRVAMCDFKPMERNHFRGWFAIPDFGNIGSKTKRSECMRKILEAGGDGEIILIRNGRHDRIVSVKFIDAFMDNGLLVVQIEPRGKAK